ncbi:CidA/LrgA family protein [Geoglobus sp.]
MYRGLAVIFGFYFVGELLSNTLNLTIPGSVLGMILLALALFSGVVKAEWCEREAEFFVKHMSILFVPPGAGIILYMDLIKSELFPIAAALFISFFATLLVTAKVVEVLR